MKWTKKSEWALYSDTTPPYVICKQDIRDQSQYRPSLGGEFLCLPVDTLKEAQQVCERHHQIMGP